VCRLQRVTLLALHQYLGLGSELIAAKHRGSKNIKGRQQRTFTTLKNIFTEDLMSADYINIPIAVMDCRVVDFFVYSLLMLRIM
jgi:hypothetical protein